MRQLLLLAVALVALSGTASAQARMRFLDSIMIHSNASFEIDRPIYRVFGFGGEYTDSVDFRLPSATRERMLPGAPPSSLYVMYDAQNVSEPTWIDRDVRGVPDSVTAGTATKFSLRYVLDIQRGTGQEITLVYPRALPAGIDSINFRDVIGGTGGFLFNETITAGPDSVTIPNEGLTRIAMIVYFDAGRIPTGIRTPLASRTSSELRLVPNPASERVALRAALPAGSRILVSDLRGASVADDRLAEAAEEHLLGLEELAEGIYFVRAIAPDGAVVAESRLIVRR